MDKYNLLVEKMKSDPLNLLVNTIVGKLYNNE